ncbi:hypothetical protein INT44_002635 [Umbelopsis vinacea]|uniref:Cytochrome c oxidase assembly factor 3 n=1 Tax=Umbelopsis vinacea TaxID=44442 RepID=A0A8H7PEV3_9FUNG|nr:hypothetical protein INT44_002635 [Umbelopsis vinacea]KAI9286734.1 hypothetical protein BC943DRAFT_321292 [Umbelopsis sp. AD052]
MAANSREKLYTTSKGYGFTPALQRTRKPFQARNILTLGALLTFVGGVYSYSIMAVKQDDFSDVPLPNTVAGVTSVVDDKK